LVEKRLSIGSRVTKLSMNPSKIEIRENASLIVKGYVKVGPGVFIIVNKNATITIGDNTYFAADSKVYSNKSIEIGKNCAISWGVTIIDTDFHEHWIDNIYKKHTESIKIGNNVWIGCNTTILKGVEIGDGSIIAAGSVVVNNVPPRSLIAGNPAKVIAKNVSWSFEEIV
jgi:acetyltransferase-like isoleucine patch superfamily enzyme